MTEKQDKQVLGEHLAFESAARLVRAYRYELAYTKRVISIQRIVIGCLIAFIGALMAWKIV